MTWRRWATWIGISAAWWSANGAVNAARMRRMAAGTGMSVSWPYALRREMCSAVLWVPFSVLALWLSDRRPLGRPTPGTVTAHGGALTAVVVGRAAAVRYGNRVGRWYRTMPSTRQLLITSALNNAAEYTMLTGIAHAVHYARIHADREARLTRARLDALRAQVAPHFLFNTLNTIAALVADDPARAERMIAQLGLILRRSLDGDGEHRVPLREELALVEAYLDIEQARFGDRLRVEWRIAPEAESCVMPPFLLQPLVENAVRHGLWPRPAGGTVTVSARRERGRLRVSVVDDGVGMSPDGNGAGTSGTGLGLVSVRQRLAALYGENHTFTIGSGPWTGKDGSASAGPGTIVRIDVPAHPREEL